MIRIRKMLLIDQDINLITLDPLLCLTSYLLIATLKKKLGVLPTVPT